MLTMHISHSLCDIMSVFWENDMVLLPGGQQTFCNDFCVDLCVNDDAFTCDVESCLSGCGAHFSRYDPSQMRMEDEGDDMVFFEGDYEMYEGDDELDAEDGDSQQMLGGDGHDNWNHDGEGRDMDQ